MNTMMTHLDGQAWYTLSQQMAILVGFFIFVWIAIKQSHALHNCLLNWFFSPCMHDGRDVSRHTFPGRQEYNF